jgi:hypothetical protein
LQECRAVAADEIRISETCFGLDGGSQNSSMLYEKVYLVIGLTILLSILSCCMSLNYLELLTVIKKFFSGIDVLSCCILFKAKIILIQIFPTR